VLYGYGRYAEAAELYRVALSKGGEDAKSGQPAGWRVAGDGGQRAVRKRR
jgi:hypothetical protein